MMLSFFMNFASLLGWLGEVVHSVRVFDSAWMLVFSLDLGISNDILSEHSKSPKVTFLNLKINRLSLSESAHRVVSSAYS